MTKTTVVHCKRDEYDVLIDRRTKWGNPFRIGPDGTRSDVIEKFAAWVITQPHLMNALHEIRGKRIACHCHPRACHGDVLARLADGEPLPKKQLQLWGE